MEANETQLRTATSNREDGGARALAKYVKIALAFDAALTAGAVRLVEGNGTAKGKAVTFKLIGGAA